MHYCKFSICAIAIDNFFMHKGNKNLSFARLNLTFLYVMMQLTTSLNSIQSMTIIYCINNIHIINGIDKNNTNKTLNNIKALYYSLWTNQQTNRLKMCLIELLSQLNRKLIQSIEQGLGNQLTYPFSQLHHKICIFCH